MASSEIGTTITVLLVLAASFVSALAVLVIVNRIARSERNRALLDYYARLGRLGPDDPCACASGRTYADCCRDRDVAELQDDVIDYQWKPWSHDSYVGRRRVSSMRQRLEEHPLPCPTLPPWVEEPREHRFPISDEVLRAWRPSPAVGPATLKQVDDSIL
jgi:hypothetical protein